MRNNLTFFERRLWKRLRKGVRDEPVWRQTVIHSFIVDFYIPSYRIAIELDGKQHDPQKDSQRDKQLFKQGITILRFNNPKNAIEVNDIFSVVYAEVRARQRNPDVEIPTNPHALSKHSRGFLGLCKGKEEEKPKKDKPGGNVEISSCGGIFTNMELGQRNAAFLSRFGTQYEAVTCEKCGRIHVIEKGTK